jgi:hypothetical protein
MNAATAAAILMGIAPPDAAAAPTQTPPATGSAVATDASGAKPANAAGNANAAGADGAKPASTEASAADQVPTPGKSADAWNFEVAPYLWFPGATGTIGAGPLRFNVNRTVGDAFEAIDELQFGLCLHAEAAKGDLSLIFDGLYMDFENSKTGPLGGKITGESTQGIFEFAGAWRLYGEVRTNTAPAIQIEALAGARLWTIDNTITLHAVPTQLSASDVWVDGFGGFRTVISTGTPLLLFGRFDCGAGGSEFTWNAIIAAEWRLADWIGLDLGWRWLSVDRQPNANDEFDIVMSGPFFAARMNF